MDSKKVFLEIMEEMKDKAYISLPFQIKILTEIEKKQINELVKGGIKNV